MTRRHETYPGFPCSARKAVRQSTGPGRHPARTSVAEADKNSTSAMPSEPQTASADTLIEIDHVTFGYDARRAILEYAYRTTRAGLADRLGSDPVLSARLGWKR